MEKYKQLIKIAKYNNALTWDYTNKQGGARENPGNPLAIGPMRGIMAKPSDEGAALEGRANWSASGGGKPARGREAGLFQKGA